MAVSGLRQGRVSFIPDKIPEKLPITRIVENNTDELGVQKISPFLWFDHAAEEAVNFSVSVSRNSKILCATRYNEARPQAKATVLTIAFRIVGRKSSPSMVA